MHWQVRQLELQNRKVAGLVVLRCFWFPSTEAEPRKGRELLAKRGEQKIKKNQVQAIRHSLVATSRIVGHQPRLPRHQQSLGTFSYKFKLSSQLCRSMWPKAFPASLFFLGGGWEMDKFGGLVLLNFVWFRVPKPRRLSLTSIWGHVWMFACGARLKWWGQRRSKRKRRRHMKNWRPKDASNIHTVRSTGTHVAGEYSGLFLHVFT